MTSGRRGAVLHSLEPVVKLLVFCSQPSTRMPQGGVTNNLA
jgi:hypothetical protein